MSYLFSFLKNLIICIPIVWVVLEAKERARILGAGVMGVGTWVLGTEVGSSGERANARNPWALSPAPLLNLS